MLHDDEIGARREAFSGGGGQSRSDILERAAPSAKIGLRASVVRQKGAGLAAMPNRQSPPSAKIGPETGRREGAMPGPVPRGDTPPPAIHSTVRLLTKIDTEEGRLRRGTEGTVVHVYRGGEVCEVEFMRPFHIVATVDVEEIALVTARREGANGCAMPRSCAPPPAPHAGASAPRLRRGAISLAVPGNGSPPAAHPSPEAGKRGRANVDAISKASAPSLATPSAEPVAKPTQGRAKSRPAPSLQIGRAHV